MAHGPALSRAAGGLRRITRLYTPGTVRYHAFPAPFSAGVGFVDPGPRRLRHSFNLQTCGQTEIET